MKIVETYLVMIQMIFVEDENDFDNDIEADLIGFCLNANEFSIPIGKKFRLLPRIMFLDVDSFRKVLYEYAIQWGFLLIKDKNKKCKVTAHYGNEGCEWRVHASPMPDDVTLRLRHVIHITRVMSENMKALVDDK